MTDVIDFESAKDRRDGAVLDADEARWNAYRDLTLAQIEFSGLSRGPVITATLRALLDHLEGEGLDRKDAKAFVAVRLNGFSDL